MRNRLVRALLALASVFAAGTVGYVLIERASWWDAFYMTVITLTTVGYHEVFPLSVRGQAFTVVLVISGLGMLLFVVTELGRQVVEGELRYMLGHVRRSRMIERLSGHEIVCGWGRTGQAVVDELQRGKRSFVVIERSPDKVRGLVTLGVHALEGDATSEGTLKAAGVERARGLVACLADDAHNVYTVLTARSLNPNIFIVARAGEPGAESRLARAGASRIVNPYHLGGIRLAQMLVKPAVVDFLDVSSDGQGGDLQLEQFHLSEETPLTGSTLASAELRKRWGVAVVAVKREGRLLPNPEPSLELRDGDVLVVAGGRQALESFERAMTR